MAPKIEPNIPLLRKTMEAIEAHPDHWDQRSWFTKWSPQGLFRRFWGRNEHKAERLLADTELCGTTMCFAGWACYLAGDEFIETSRLVNNDVATKDYVKTADTGETMYVQARAMQLLGLTEDQADEIFSACAADTPERMRVVVEDTIGEKL